MALVLLGTAFGCGRTNLAGSLVETSSDAAAPADTTNVPAAAPATVACGPTPRRLVDRTDFPAPPAGVSIGLGPIRATAAGVYYTVWLASKAPSGAYVGGSLWRVPLAGGVPQQVANGSLFGRPVVTGQGLLVAEGGIGDAYRIALSPFSGGAPQTIFTLATQEGGILSLASDGTSALFADQDEVEAVPLDPASGHAAVTLAFGMDVPSVVGAVAQRLILIHPQGTVESVDLPLRPDSKPVARGSCAPGSTEFLAWGTRAYWRAGMNILETMDAVVGSPTALATMTGPLLVMTGFDFDGTNFYLVGEDENRTALTLATMPGDGGAPVALVTMPHVDGSSVSVDDQCVYWSAADGIYSLAKSAPPESG